MRQPPRGFGPPLHLLLHPFLLLLLFSLPSLASSTSTSGSNCTLSFPPLTPATLYGNATLRTVYVQARAVDGTLVSGPGDLFTASLFSTTPSCDTNLTYPHCQVTCSPLSFPYTPSPACVSSPYPPLTSFTPASPNWVPIAVTYLSSGLYSLTYLPSHPDVYTLSLSLLTQGGLRGTYYDNVWFLPPASLQRIDPVLSFNWSTGAITPTATDYVSARWHGALLPPTSDTYTLYALADDWVRVWLDRRLIIDAWGGGCCNETWASVTLQAAYPHDLIVDYAELRGTASLTLQWRSSSLPKQLIPTTALYYRTAVQGAPFTGIAIGPGDPAAATSTAHDTDVTVLGAGRTGGLTVGVAGVVGSVLLKAADVFGNVVTNATTNASLVQCTLTGPDPAPVVTLGWVGGGVYEANYTAVVSGAYSLSLRVAGVNVPGSPFPLTLTPAPTFPANCVPGTLPTGGVAGVTTTFTVQLKDVWGNNRTTAAGDTLYVTWVNGGTGVGYQGVTATLAAGLLVSSFTPTVAGMYALTVIVDTVTVGTASVPVTPGALAAAACTATGGGLTTAVAGVPANVSVVARDVFGNRLTSSTAVFVYNVTGTGVGGVLAGGAGVYNGSYVLGGVGVYTLTVTAGGVGVQGSPFTVTVTAGAMAPALSSVVPPVPTQATSGSPLTFRVQARDGSGNALTQGGAAYTATLQCVNTVTSATVTDPGTGVYVLTVTPTTAGACVLYVVALGVNVSASPFPVTVSPGPATGNSTSFGLGRTAGIAGVPSVIGLTAYDGAGNAVTSGGAAVVLTVTPASHATPSPAITAADYNTGNYTFTYTPTAAGGYTTALALRVPGGVRGSYYTDPALTVLFGQRVDAGIAFVWLTTPPLPMMPAGYYSVQWDGWVQAPTTGVYTFYVQSIADTGVRLTVGGQAVIAAWAPGAGTTQTAGSLALAAGTPVSFQLQYTTLGSGGSLQLLWSCPGAVALQVVPAAAFSYADPVAGSPFTTTVAPASTQAAQSAYTAGSGWVVGVAVAVTVTLRDAYGNLQALTNETSLLAAVLTVGATAYPATLTPTSPGVYGGMATPMLAGAGVLQVKYRGVQVGAVTTGVVAVGGLSLVMTGVLSPAALTPVYAGVAQTVAVQTRDVGNNSLTADSRSASNPLTCTLVSGVYSEPCSQAYVGPGQYALMYTVRYAGTYALGVAFGGVGIAGSPFTLQVTAGLPSPTYTTASPPINTSVTAGATNFTVLETYDTYGNPATIGGALFVVKLHGPAAIRGQVYDDGNGTYIALYDPTVPGDYTGDILLAQGASAAAPGVGSGLTGTYYNNRWLTAPAAQVRVDPVVSFNWGNDSSLMPITPTARDYVSVTWTGYVRVDVPGTYTFTVAAGDGARLYVDSLTTPVIDQFAGPAGLWSATVTTAAAYAPRTLVDVRLDYRHNLYLAYVQLNWSCGGCMPTVANTVVPTTNLFPGATTILTSPLVVGVTL